MNILIVCGEYFNQSNGLSLIAGWYGMNFRYMPELEWRYGYLAVFLLSVAVIVYCLILFKRKKWL